jgi:serine O-acetyltransferase
MHASILSHSTLEKSLAFHMANLLSSPAMISTQIQALFLESLEKSQNFRNSLRIDIQAVATRDPAVKSLTDVLLYFKGFHALQTHRVSSLLWKEGRKTLGESKYYLIN